jgi:flavin reductase (DIM6/NTAB) family NADH-FMN oxidoreductase RutF
MKTYKKKNLPVSEIRRYLEPGPVVLVTSRWKQHSNIMTMGWHTVMEFTPSLLGCVIASGNYSFELIRRSKECVINIPTMELIDEVAGVGNCSGASVDKFEKFGFTPAPAQKVGAPLLPQCFANLECRLFDSSLVGKYNFFIFEVVKAHVALAPKYPQTMHYTGDGIFTATGKVLSRRGKFRAQNL